MLTRAQVVAEIMEAVAAVQVASGRFIEALSEGTILLGGIEGFDSLNCLEVLAMVEASLGADLSDELLGPLNGEASLSIGGLANRILDYLEAR